MQRNLTRRAIVASAIATLLAACAHAGNEPRDYATERLSQGGAYRVSYRTDPQPIPVKKLHTWTLHVARADGTPVTDAVIGVDGDMPEHMHGLPTRPRVTAHLGNGDYLVEGVKFQMGGWWVMDFDIASGGRKDKVRFNLQLPR